MDTLSSRFRIIECVGQGGRGVVYQAEDQTLRRIVALKVLRPELACDVAARQALMEEARRAAALSHPHIATLYGLDQEDGKVFLVMEYVDGETLTERMRRERLSIVDSLNFAGQMADAIEYAHEQAVLHGDLKPSNIKITRNGETKILDFGLGGWISAASEAGDGKLRAMSPVGGLTRRGGTGRASLTGTVGYFSPEQAHGKSIVAGSDIFSLGVVLYEMVTGVRPFSGRQVGEYLRSLTEDTPRPMSIYRDDVPMELEKIVARSLQKDIKDRYASAEDMREEIAGLQNRLEWGRAMVSLHGSEWSSADVVQTSSIPARESHVTFSRSTVVGPLRSFLLVLAVISFLSVGFDLLLIRPGKEGILRDAVLAGIWILATTAFLILRKEVRVPPPSASAVPAFRGLLPFMEADRDRFYGREAELGALAHLVTHEDFRFGVLFGESGCGKTSLVRAGLIPQLWEDGYIPVYCRSRKDPLIELMEESRRRTEFDPKENEPPLEYVRRAAGCLDAPLLFIFDQFEEFLVRFKSHEQREPFISFVESVYRDAKLPVKFLFCVRSDFLYLIDLEFEGRVEDPLRSSRLFHLRNFDEGQAAGVIERSMLHAGLVFDPRLCRVVARDLAVGDTVLSSELQIVGERIQSKRLFTVHDYRRAGGKEPLVYSFLEDVIQSSPDKEGAKLVLRSLISDENRRWALSVEDISRRTQRSKSSVEKILNVFVESRLIREIQEEDPWRYELLHEYLIEQINQITGKVSDARQRANRLFQRYFSEFIVDGRTRIPMAQLWFIRHNADLSWSPRELKLLRSSWRRGLLSFSAIFLIISVIAVAVTGALSVNETWEGVRLSDGHTAAARAVVFTPDGKRLVSCGEDGQVIVWDFEHRERLATLNGHHGWVTALAVSPDGRWIATGGVDQKIMVWNAQSYEPVKSLPEGSKSIQSVVFSPDSRELGAIGNKVSVWEVDGWKKVMEAPWAVSYGTLLFSPRGDQLLISSGWVFDIHGNNSSSNAPLPGFNWAAITRDGLHLVGVDSTGIVSFWDFEEAGKLDRRRLVSERRVHHDHGRIAAFSPDGSLAATGAEDVVLWDARTHAKLARFQYTSIVWSVAFSPDGKWLVSSHGDGSIVVWSVPEREQVANFNEHSGAVRAVTFSSDSRWVASAGDDGSIIVWDAEHHQKSFVLIGHQTRVTAVAFAPDNSWLASCDQDGYVILWDLGKKHPRMILQQAPASTPQGPSYAVAISPDGRWVASSNCVFDSQTGDCALRLDSLAHPQYGRIYGVDFSDDGRVLACVTDRGDVELWDTRNWNLLNDAQLEGMQLISVSFSPDRKQLVTVEDSGWVRLWSTAPLRELGVLGRHTARVKSVSFSPDGQVVASAGDDGMIALWDVQQRRLLHRIGTPHAPVLAVAFSPDGRSLVAGDSDRSVFLYSRHRSLWGRRLD